MKPQLIELAYQLGASPLWVAAVDAIEKGNTNSAINAIIAENALMELRAKNYLAEAARYDHPLIKAYAGDEELSELYQDIYFGFYKQALIKLGVEESK